MIKLNLNGKRSDENITYIIIKIMNPTRHVIGEKTEMKFDKKKKKLVRCFMEFLSNVSDKSIIILSNKKSSVLRA